MKLGRINIISCASMDLLQIPQIENSKFEKILVKDLLNFISEIWGTKESNVVESELYKNSAFINLEETRYIEDSYVILLRTEISIDNDQSTNYEPHHSAMKIIDLLRLFNTHDIYMFYYLNYFLDDSGYRRAGKAIIHFTRKHNLYDQAESRWFPIGQYAIDKQECTKFIEFYKKYNSYIAKGFINASLNSAYNAYRESFTSNEWEISFILLISALESLFSNNSSELNYRVSRNVAIALSHNL